MNPADFPIPIKKALDFADDSYTKKTIKVGNAECYVTQFNEYQIVAPRGTASLNDVVADMAAWPWYNSDVGWAHYGFMAGGKRLVKHGLRGLLRLEEPIIVIGHSLGGAYALICALKLAALGFKVEAVITFGCPKALYSDGAVKRFSKKKIRVWQYSNPGDPITDVPAMSGQHVREFKTGRPADGYSASNNHSMTFYREAFGYE